MKIDDTTGLNKEYGIKKDAKCVRVCVCKRVKKSEHREKNSEQTPKLHVLTLKVSK